MAMSLSRTFQKRELRDPGFITMIFSNTWLAPLWLVARVYLGYQWLLAGSHKVWGADRWIARPGPDGLSLKAFWDRATAIPEKGAPVIKYDWYRNFLNYMSDNGWYHWFSWVIGCGEVTVGVLLIIGAFTGLAALGGAALNFNFMLAGSASTNPVLFILAILILLGWKVSGWMGVDRWLLPALGTPWEPGPVMQSHPDDSEGRPAAGLRPQRGPA